MLLCQDTLDEFVRRTDESGGPLTPECNEFWAGLEYQPTVELNSQLSPLGVEYKNEQLALYAEITGKSYGGMSDEFTPNVPVERLLLAPNAYDHPSPAGFAKHCVAVGMFVEKLDLPRGSNILELGSGWGMCQEFLASCGFETVGIDANPDFVDASNNRMARLGYGKRIRHCGFDDINVTKFGTFDGIIAYEAFHHALDANDLLQRSVECLKEEGVFGLGAEPFNNYYATWGLRRDPYSIYCIRKFGWFESGWSANYMAYLFGLNGLIADFDDSPVSDLTRYMIGRRSSRRALIQLGMWHPEVSSSVFVDQNGLFFKDKSKLIVPAPLACTRIELELKNFSPRPLAIRFNLRGEVVNENMSPGSRRIELIVPKSSEDVREIFIEIESELFCPIQEGINDDNRNIGVYLDGVSVY